MADTIAARLPNYASEEDYTGSTIDFYNLKENTWALTVLSAQYMSIDVAVYPLSPLSFIQFPYPPP